MSVRLGEPLPDRLTGEEVRRFDAELRAMARIDLAGQRLSNAALEGFRNPYVFLASDLDDPDVTVR